MVGNLLSAKKMISLDIGSGTVKAVELRRTRNSVVIDRVAVKRIPFVESETSEARTATVIETIQSLLKENKISAKKAIFGLPGHQVFVRKMRLPIAPEDRLAKIIAYEARHQIPFPLDKIQLDYQISQIPESTEVEVLLVGSKKESIAEYIEFLSKTGIKPLFLDVTPVALYNFHKYIDPTPSEEAIALMNIGASATDISIIRNGKLSFTRTAPIGGIEITRGIASTLNISLNEAEDIKINEGKAPLELELFEESEAGNETKQREKLIQDAVGSALEKLIGEIRRTFDYYISQPDGIAIGRIILSGGTSKLPGIAQFLEMKIGTTVQLVQDYPTWQGLTELRDSYSDQLPFLTTCVGLALRGLPKVTELIKVDFLPEEIKSVREFSAKRIELAIATGLLAAIIFTGAQFGGNELKQKQEAISLLNQKALASKAGYDKYQKINQKKDNLVKQYDNLSLVIANRTYWLDKLVKLNQMTPVDVWFTKITGGADYTLIIEGKALREDSVVDFGNRLNNPANKHHFKKSSLDEMKTQTDDRLGKPVTVFRFTVQCKPPTEKS
ncbi:MAG: type IV pilus assembly protein PilM [bacterium]|nr:type IV pilus assembly protein PilM [bacterium]